MMDILPSRCGFYCITFIDVLKWPEKKIEEEFSSVGKVFRVHKNFDRVFVRFKEKDDALKALSKYKNSLNVEPARNENNKRSIVSKKQKKKTTKKGDEEVNLDDDASISSQNELPELPKLSNMSQNNSKIFNLVLGNLPNNYTVKDVKALVAETKKLKINEIDETNFCKMKFCCLTLDSEESLLYLINKLNGFTISGNKLIAVEENKLLNWCKLAV